MADTEAQFREDFCSLLESRRPQGYWTGWYVEIGNGIRRDGKTVRNWAEGKTLPNAHDFLALCRFFASRGDLDFAQNLIGTFLGVHIGTGATAAEQKLEQVKEWHQGLQAIIDGKVVQMPREKVS